MVAASGRIRQFKGTDQHLHLQSTSNDPVRPELDRGNIEMSRLGTTRMSLFEYSTGLAARTLGSKRRFVDWFKGN